MQDITPPTKRFKPEMPQIPGVNDGSVSSRTLAWKPALLLLVFGIAIMILGAVAWQAVHLAGRRAGPPSDATKSQAVEPTNFPPFASSSVSGPVKAATVSELSKPWSAKKFTFVDPVTHQAVPAMIIHLPGAAANSSAAYWAFSLQAPYERCQLEYIPDPNQVAARFGYHAAHPMVAAACDGTIYDPLQLATISTGAWVRGQIVQGEGIRPPISIEIKVRGGDLIADQIE
jgi:hypothetical protein